MDDNEMTAQLLFHAYRTNCRGVGGLVDYLGRIAAESQESAEDVARLMFACDYAAGEKIEVESDQIKQH